MSTTRSLSMAFTLGLAACSSEGTPDAGLDGGTLGAADHTTVEASRAHHPDAADTGAHKATATDGSADGRSAPVDGGRDGKGASIDAGKDGKGASVDGGRDGKGASVDGGRDGGGDAGAPLPYGYASNGLGSDWTLVFDEEFNTVFSTPTGLDPSKWATGWGTTDNGGLTWPVPGDNSDPGAWAICDPTMSVVATGAVDGRTGSFLWQSVAYKQQTDVKASNYAQSSVQSNPTWGSNTWGASPGAQFTPEIYLEASIWTSTDADGHMYNWPSFWLASQNDPTTGELDVLEGIGGVPNYHWHNGSNGPGGSVSGNWSGWHTYAAHWTSTAVTWFYDGVDVGTVTSGILTNPMFIDLSMGYPSYQDTNDSAPTMNASGPAGLGVVPQQITDYVRVWAP